MKYFKLFFLAIAILASCTLAAQVAITTDGSDPDASVMLDVKSSDKGFLPPRMTQAEISAIIDPANGLIVYNTDNSRFYFFDSAEELWQKIALGASTLNTNCGTVTDADGNTYNTIVVGTKCWMAENLNIGTMVNGSSDQTNNTTIEKYCYNDNTANCDTLGGLYHWDEMMQYVTTEGTQGICPTGWHLPTDAEWTTLTDYLGGEGTAGGKMKAVSDLWQFPNTGATNSSGFSGLPGGGYSSGSFGNLGLIGYWWSSTQNLPSTAWCRAMYNNFSYVNHDNLNKTYWFSVRCLRDF